MRAVILWTALVWSAAFAQVMAPMPNLTPEQEQQLHSIASNLRCLVCQGQSVADSNSDFSQEVKRQIATFIVEKRTTQEIEQFFAKRYGETILLDPPKKGISLILWGLPVLAFCTGTALWWNVVNRKNEDLPEGSLERVEKHLNDRGPS
ncbi:MAG: cytochrome c-type biogenesis protein [Deinococcaceae bacterium]